MLILVITLVLFLAGCGKATIDTSTDEKMKASIETVKNSLPDDRKDNFEEALQIVVSEGIDFLGILMDSKADTGATERKLKDAIHGKTGEEILDLAAKIKARGEANREREEAEKKVKVQRFLGMAEDLSRAGEFDKALDQCSQARWVLSGDDEVRRHIAEMAARLKAQRKTERVRAEAEREAKRVRAEAEREDVRKLTMEAQGLLKGKKFEEALSKYRAMSKLASGVEAAEIGIKTTTEAMRLFTQKMNYMDKIEITEFIAKRIDTYSKKGVPAVSFSIKNKGDRSLDKVKIIVYFQDRNGNTIFEEDYFPVLVSDYSLGRDNKPLKPGYVKEMEKDRFYTLKSPLTEWQEGKAVVKIVDIEFTK